MILPGLEALALKTQIIVNCVGPYHLYSSPVVEACANNGTHYLDVTGETPWVKEMVEQHHEKAKATGAIIIPEIGFESAPSDLLAFSIVSAIRSKLGLGTKEIICSMHEIKAAGWGVSGGTLATVLSIFDAYGIKRVAEASKPFALCPPSTPRKPSAPKSWSQILFGYSIVPGLGVITTSITAGTNAAIVHRSSALMEGLYGQYFRFYEYMGVPSRFKGATTHWSWALLAVLLAMPPVRWLLRKIVYAPGTGPSVKGASNDTVEYRAIGTADGGTGKPRQAMGQMKYKGSIYYLTGVFLAHAAMVILRDDSVAKKMGGGVLTPATLGQPLIDRLRTADVMIAADIIDE